MSEIKFPLSVYKTPTAERKIIEIARWSVKKWGKKTARSYLASLEKIINLIASGELPCQKNPEFSTRFSYYPARQHYIFFEFQKGKLVVVTIFHTAMHIKERMYEEKLLILHEIKEL